MHLFFVIVHNFLVAVSEFLSIFAAKKCYGLGVRAVLPCELKRESGANPEQTRCCEFRDTMVANTLATVFPLWEMGRRKPSGASQKTCQEP